MGVIGKVIVLINDKNSVSVCIEYEISNAQSTTNQWLADWQAMVVVDGKKTIVGRMNETQK